MSTQVFSRTDLVMDSERFYNSILELLDDQDEKGEVDQLMAWWNRCVIFEITDFSLMKATDKYFRYIPILNAFRPKTARSLGFARNAWSTRRGKQVQLMNSSDVILHTFILSHVDIHNVICDFSLLLGLMDDTFQSF